jgi:hypothetical protein
MTRCPLHRSESVRGDKHRGMIPAGAGRQALRVVLPIPPGCSNPEPNLPINEINHKL